MRRFRSALAHVLLAALFAVALGPCAAMAMAQGTEACTMAPAARGHCAPDVALGPTCCHTATAPAPAEAPVVRQADVPLTAALLWTPVAGPATTPVPGRRAVSRHALVLGSPPLFLQHRTLLI